MTTFATNEDKKRFVYYPLPVEPERTTIPEGGENWYHLLSTISLIRSVLPKNNMLIIKEHPSMFMERHPLFGYRSSLFYQEITNLPNTYLVSHNVSSHLIIKLSKVVIINSGSSGFEAFLNGTSVISLGSPWYKDIKGIINASTNKDLSSALKLLISQKDTTLSQIKKSLGEFLKRKKFIYGSTSAGLSKLLNNLSNKKIKEHSYKSAFSLLNYMHHVK